MSQLEDLKPTGRPRVIDLVSQAGLDVSDWANFTRGAKWAAANPKYCYEWSFAQPGHPIVVNLWHSLLRERGSALTWSLNLRSLIQDYSVPGAKTVWRRRAESLGQALDEAWRHGRPIRAIINDGDVRKSTSPDAEASQVQFRLLDPLPWAVTSHDAKTGVWTLTRGASLRGSVDQFDLPPADDVSAERIETTRTVFVRDPGLRAAALLRANGRCEFCLQPGFTLPDGRVFLETHHVIPLSEGGSDSANNVAAVCPNHHREAHYGAGAADIRKTLLAHLRLVATGTRTPTRV